MTTLLLKVKIFGHQELRMFHSLMNLSVIYINVSGTLSNNGQIIAKAFNNYFVSVAQNILLDNRNSNNESSKNDNPLAYLLEAFNHFPI
jgi:hypothetical protein